MRNLHIGGQKSSADKNWEIFNIIEEDWVDHAGNANDMSRFEDETFDRIYASHILEHFDYTGEIQSTLKEWLRILKKGARLYVSVPSLKELCKLFLDESLDFDERVNVMRFIIGGHMDEHDYHKAMLDQEMLLSLLREVGFMKVWRVSKFDFFSDNSSGLWKGHTELSLNMVAERER